LLYTGATGAKRLVVLVGQEEGRRISGAQRGAAGRSRVSGYSRPPHIATRSLEKWLRSRSPKRSGRPASGSRN